MAAEEQSRRLDSQAEQERLKADLQRAYAKLHALEVGLGTQKNCSTEVSDRRLASYDDLEDWAEEVLGETVFIHRQALKDCRKNGHPNMLQRIEQALLIIRDFVVPAFREGGLERKDRARARLAEIGMDDCPCFSNREAAKHEPEYSVVYEGERAVLYDHIRYGNGYNNANQVRIYYFWDEERRRFVVGKMPSHLRNNLTN